jgi:hypothetical protein
MEIKVVDFLLFMFHLLLVNTGVTCASHIIYKSLGNTSKPHKI